MKMRNNLPKPLGHSKDSVKREVYQYECLHPKKKCGRREREISNK
jgi:hypothetical protein